MKYTIRWKWWKILIYGFISTTQKVSGLTSRTYRENYHYILWDFDSIEYHQVVKELERIMIKWKIDGVAIFSDKVNSYRAFSDMQVDFKTLLKIILDTEYVDRMFFKWTVKRGYATIRTGRKIGRENNKIIGIIGKINLNFVKENFKFIEYETDE